MATTRWDSARKLALAGSAIMAVGSFLPVISIPMVGRLTYVHDGSGDGIFVIGLAIVAAALALWGRTRWVVLPGALALLVMLWTVMRFQQTRENMRMQLDAAFADGPLRDLAENALQSTALQWGWAVLVAGALLTIFAGVRAWLRGRVAAEVR